jgi:flagellum-specific ATP synthase
MFSTEVFASAATPSSPTTRGVVISVEGPVVSARLPLAGLGDLCSITLRTGKTLQAVVVGFQGDVARLAPYESPDGITPGSPVLSAGLRPMMELPNSPLGGVYDVFGKPLVTSVAPRAPSSVLRLPLHRSPPPALSRRSISEPFETGIKVIDGLCSLGVGQRIGLFAGAGVGKSTLLGAIARNSPCDVAVVALVGERGREVGEFLHDALGESGIARSIVIVATSDESALRRSLAAHSATAVAEHYRAQGKKVLLLVDSLTRVARAIREVTLAAGEVPVRQGYTPTVYAELPRLLERSGNDAHGSITAIYTVLTNGEDETDPLAEEAKSLLDGHLYLDSKIAERGIRPAIDPLRSVSRLMSRVRSGDELAAANSLRKALARLRKDKDLLLFGGTPDGELKRFLDAEPKLTAFLSQSPKDFVRIEEASRQLEGLRALL